MGWLHPVLAMYQREALHDGADRVGLFITSNQEKLSKEFKPLSADFKVPAGRAIRAQRFNSLTKVDATGQASTTVTHLVFRLLLRIAARQTPTASPARLLAASSRLVLRRCELREPPSNRAADAR